MESFKFLGQIFMDCLNLTGSLTQGMYVYSLIPTKGIVILNYFDGRKGYGSYILLKVQGLVTMVLCINATWKVNSL